MSYLTDDALGEYGFTPEEFAMELAMLDAHGYQQIVHGCAQQGESDEGIRVRCDFDMHVLRSDELGLGPYAGNYWEMTIRDGKIVFASRWTGRT